MIVQTADGGAAAAIRYGPLICSAGTAVICQACRIPMPMISALSRPPGSEPRPISTGSASEKPSKNRQHHGDVYGWRLIRGLGRRGRSGVGRLLRLLLLLSSSTSCWNVSGVYASPTAQ